MYQPIIRRSLSVAGGNTIVLGRVGLKGNEEENEVSRSKEVVSDPWCPRAPVAALLP